MSIKLNREKVQKAIDRLLALAPEYSAPVPIEMIAQLKGIRLRYVAHDDNLLGLLLWEEGRPVIGVNNRHDRIWQRFIIAHEMAHLELRHYNGIHIDRNFPLCVKAEATGANAAEVEASMVASELLIPATSLETDLRGKSIDYLDDTFLRSLADRYQVSLQTMMFRLAL